MRDRLDTKTIENQTVDFYQVTALCRRGFPCPLHT